MSPLYNTFYRLQFSLSPLAPNGTVFGSDFIANAPYLPIEVPARNMSGIEVQYDSERLGRTGLAELGMFSGSEEGCGSRYSRFMDPSIDYAYRSGNYFGR